MTKVFDVTLTQVGAFIGGVLSMRLGVMGVLLGAVLGAGSKLLLAWLGSKMAGRLLGPVCRCLGYSLFFTMTALLGVLVLVWLASRLKPGSTGAPGQPLDL